jgi:transposase, IS5 family
LFWEVAPTLGCAPLDFGYVEQLAEVTPNTKPGTRGFVVPPVSAPGNPGENKLLPTTMLELHRLGLRPRQVALDGGFQTKASTEELKGEAQRTATSPTRQPASRRRVIRGK